MVILLGMLGCLGTGYLFYDSWIGSICLLPAVVILCRWYGAFRKRRQKAHMLLEFKELLYALAANLRTGYAMENAWIAAGKDIQLLYPQGCLLSGELEMVAAKLHLNVPIEKAVREFAQRSCLEEIDSFAEVLATAKRSGGNLVHMMEKTITVITEKIELEQEIQTMLSGKRLEQRILCGMPILMLLYLRLTNPSYLNCMYHNWIGISIMTVCLAGTGIAAYWGSRIVGIEV